MSDAISNYAENKLMEHLFGKTAWSLPSDGSRVWIALCTTAPTDSSTGSTIVEPSGNNYARCSTLAADWNAASGGQIDNANAFTFNEASGSWGTITHFALVDASSGGNVLAWGALTTSKSVTSGVTAKIEAGALVLSFTAGSDISNHLRGSLLAHLVGKAAYTQPTIYIALTTGEPLVGTAGSAISEPSGSGYARKSTSGSDWSSASGGEIHNSGEIQMAAASGTWVSGSDLAYVVLTDASSSGNVLMWAAPSVAKPFANLDKPYFAASDLSFTLN